MFFELLLLFTLGVFLFLLYWIIIYNRKVKFSKNSKLLLAEGFIDYDSRLNIFSNNGRHWYYVYFTEKQIAKVMGRFQPARANGPSWQKVVNYVYANGPIKYSDTKGLKLLLKAGFKDGEANNLSEKDFKKRRPF